MDIPKVFEELKSSKNGLNQEESHLRLKKQGYNEFEKAKPTPIIIRFFKQMADPMIIILLVAAAISMALALYQGDSFADVIIILAVVIINAMLGVYQESKAEKSIEALQEMSRSKSKVVRDGDVVEIESRNLVPGDVVLLEAGDVVPADGRIIECASMKIEEAALTGESVPVEKAIQILNLQKNNNEVGLADRCNMAYMGTTVVYGRGTIVVTETGMDTQMGKIAGALSDVQDNKTPLQIKMVELSKILTKVVIVVCLAVFAIQLLRYGWSDVRVVLNCFMIAITLAVSAIPEGLPAVVTIVLSLGVTKMSKRNAIIRKLTAVETLGCAQIICSDKTGTLTQNKMTVTDCYSDNKDILSCSIALCCDAKIEKDETIGEPTEVGLVNWAAKSGFNTDFVCKNFKRIDEIPFDSSRKMMTTFNKICSKSVNIFNTVANSESIIQITKGGPDIVLSLCNYILKDGKVVKLSQNMREEIMFQSKRMSDKALRVLACGLKIWDKKPSKISNNTENDLVFIGLTGMIDPVRPEVKAAIDKAKSAGISPIMITGDNVDTARAIAKDLDILSDEYKAIGGQDLNALSDDEFKEIFKDIRVYARVQPEHKTRIVKMWQEAGCVVAMTGDGVNDAPSIKSADIGIGMGITGTDVTKNAADMVLTDDNFATIVNAVEEGRRIYDNILKAIQFLLGSNVGEVLSVVFASVCGFIILKPVHLLWVNLVTDCFPALALGLEEKEPGLMERKPRDKNKSIFADGMWFDIVYQGLVIVTLIVLSYFIGFHFQYGYFDIGQSEIGITMAFLTMSMVSCFHSINLRSRRQSIFMLKKQNWLLYASVLASLVFTTMVCEIPFIAEAFQLTSVTLREYAIAIGLGITVIPIVEIVKFIQRRVLK